MLVYQRVYESISPYVSQLSKTPGICIIKRDIFCKNLCGIGIFNNSIGIGLDIPTDPMKLKVILQSPGLPGENARLEMFQNTRCVLNVVKTMVRHFAAKETNYCHPILRRN